MEGILVTEINLNLSCEGILWRVFFFKFLGTIDHRDDDGDHDNGTPEAANSSASGSATVPAGHAPVHSQPGPCRGAFVAWHDDGSFGSRHGRCRRGRAARDEILKLLIYPYPKKKYKYRIIQNWSTNFGTSPT